MQSENNSASELEGECAVLIQTDKERILVLDTSAFFLALDLTGHLYTVPRVEKELKDLRSKARFAVLIDEGMIIKEPGKKFYREAMEAARLSGDAAVLSDTDASLIALAREVNGILVTDDFAIQNTAHVLKIPVQPIIQREATLRIRQIRCTGCGKFFDVMPDKTGDCPICGSPLKRKHK